MLLTAHHLEDQAETVLLQMLRGAGVEGLSAMPLCRDWYGRWLVRPLLAASRDEILAWARARGIAWVDDPSNADSGPERNYLRHTVLPALTARWPAAARSLARSAHLCAQAAQTVAEQADADLTRAGVDAGARLRIDVLCALEPARAANLLRRWLRARVHRRCRPRGSTRRCTSCARRVRMHSRSSPGPDTRCDGFAARPGW